MKKDNKDGPPVNSHKTIILSGIVLILFAFSMMYAQTKGYGPNVSSYGYGTELFKVVDHYFGVNGVFVALILIGLFIVFVGFRAKKQINKGNKTEQQAPLDRE
jgi:putative Mn2+ efflux pump MntP